MDHEELQSHLQTARGAAAEGAAVLRRLWRGAQTALAETAHDVKLQADRDSESAILAVLARTGLPRLAEESGESGGAGGGGLCWVVDPLDGTMNFSRGIPFCAVSVALCRDGAPLVGVVDDFVHGEVFYGAPGLGAWLNGAPVRVSGVTRMERAVLGTGNPIGFDYDDAGALAHHHLKGRFRKARQMGSAALLLAYVACGRMDAYLEDDILLWDIAAGAALVEAAGGFVSIHPSPTHPWARAIRAASAPSVWEA